jgi:hypothetical protein
MYFLATCGTRLYLLYSQSYGALFASMAVVRQSFASGQSGHRDVQPIDVGCDVKLDVRGRAIVQ